MPDSHFYGLLQQCIQGCDGLWDVMSDQQAVDLCLKCLKSQADQQHVSKYLVDEAIRRGTTDNVTVVVAWL
jgi:serine/threonine protein phosphatase PrpC